MSIPAETPAAVITSPASTNRSSRTSTPRARSRSTDPQCVVAGFPSSAPAAWSTNEPVQTLVNRPPRAAIARSCSCSAWSALGPVEFPPGTRITSTGGAVSQVWSARTRSPLAQSTGSVESAIVKALTPSSGQRSAHADSTSQGPAQSSSSDCS